LKIDNEDLLEESGFKSINGKFQENLSHYNEENDENMHTDYVNEEAAQGYSNVDDIKFMTHNPRISKCAISQANPDSKVSTVFNKQDSIRRADSIRSSKFPNQFTPMNKVEDIVPSLRKSQSALSSIGVSRVKIDNNNAENVEGFEIKEPVVTIPVRKTTRIKRQASIKPVIRTFNYHNFYKIAAVLGFSALAYCLYQDNEAMKILKDVSNSGKDVAIQGFNTTKVFVTNNSQLVISIVVGVSIVIILLVMIKKMNSISRDNQNLIAENCVFRVVNRLKEISNNSEPFLNIDEELLDLARIYKLSDSTIRNVVYPKMRDLLELHNVEETNIYKDGELMTIWKIK
jgi:hypothetical protein